MKEKLLLIKSIFISMLMLVILGSCAAEEKKEFAEIEEISDEFTLENDFAQGFQIIYHISFIEINIIDPDTKEIVDSYKISKTDQSSPDLFPKNMSSVVAMSTTQLGMMRKLSLEEKVTGFSDFNLLCNPLSEAAVKEVGHFGMSDAEAFIAINPDIIFYSGFDDSAPILSKLKQANLKTFKILEWKETHPLGRAEWIKVYGAIFQKEQKASAIFDEIKAKYYNIKDKLKIQEKGSTAFAGTYFGDIFNVPAGDSYMAILFEDANIDYVYAKTKGVGSLNLSLEETITKNVDTEFWLNAGASSKKELLNQSQKFKMLKAMRTGKLYSYFGNNNCFWENSPIEPHLLLEDLGKIFHPELFEDDKLNFYELIAE
ncbi:ABC transporter substrate-binding protein [Brumimicrobium mesophilum]|uniref:ABC transporter substrate-binding protein n=1 Tax=Brumimicrobium mesophilum TaxID=392717 RepID=UPI000D141445|nr:ABC transporter substrate-binding protein [Brumimicrobium mesophilum]